MDKKGYVFLCSEVTEPECVERGLFGGKEKYLKRVKGLEKGDILFSYNYDSKRLLGIFEAESEMQENIVPEAWKGEFPWQVRARRIATHPNISREDIGPLLKFDARGRPTSRLTPETVKALVALFRSEHRTVQYDDGTRYHCDDGHKVRSKAEQVICNWMFTHRICHAYEYLITEAKKCDFFVPDDNGGRYIEYWGRNDHDYLANKEFKRSIYKAHGLNLLEIEIADTKHIAQILEREFGV